LHHDAILLAPGECPSAARPMSARGEFVYGKSRDQIEFFFDRTRRSHFYVLVVRDDARGAFLQRLRQGAAAGSGGLLQVLRIAAQVEH
jgi:hypothetical protein